MTAGTSKLSLPTTNEEIRKILSDSKSDYHARLSQFVQPVEKAEVQVAEILSRLPETTGRALLVLGKTGCGKSTFVESLNWRKHLGFARLVSIDCSELKPTSILDELAESLQQQASKAGLKSGRTAIAIDYLESLGGRDTQAFFQTLNGLLRKSPIFVVWPVTKRTDADDMLNKARAVSGTIFDKKIPILEFGGPSPEHYPAIATNTISVFNDGKLLQEFLLTPAELDAIRDNLANDPEEHATVREYLERVNSHWESKSGHLESVRKKLPKPNEIWIVFCHSKAEDLVGQFATKGKHVASAWKAYHSKLWEYIPNTQRESFWNPTELQYAIEGVFTSRILHLSPQSVVSTCMAYGPDKLEGAILSCPPTWKKKDTAKRHMKTTALYRQLIGEPPARGKTKGGPAASARALAKDPFGELNDFLSGSGRDRHVNRALAGVLTDVLPGEFLVEAETAHPWIPGITPDIRIDAPDGRQICLEFCYTNKSEDVWRVPDYVLDKLATYMQQIQLYVNKSQMP